MLLVLLTEDLFGTVAKACSYPSNRTVAKMLARLDVMSFLVRKFYPLVRSTVTYSGDK